jgi:hypothetical protein
LSWFPSFSECILLKVRRIKMWIICCAISWFGSLINSWKKSEVFCDKFICFNHQLNIVHT